MSNYFEPISFAQWSSQKSHFSKALMRSFQDTGFAVITDHGLDQDIISAATARSKDFFALPTDQKLAYYDKQHGGQRGYTPFGTENAKGQTSADLKEFWHTGRAGKRGNPYAAHMRTTPDVSEIDGFDTATRALFASLDRFGQSILEAVALGLDLAQTWFTPRVDEGNSILRLLHYPAQTEAPPPGSVRAHAHEDINVITLLLGAEEAGLEVLHRSGTWLAINPPKGALVVNVGDMLQRLTNGKLPSTTHRVVNPPEARKGVARYSMPFFLHFAPDVLIAPLESCIDDSKDVLPAITAHDYLMQRLQEIGLIKS